MIFLANRRCNKNSNLKDEKIAKKIDSPDDKKDEQAMFLLIY